jgi:hypothetical protein
MDDILEEASALVQCQECPWYKSCVMPLRFTAEDLKREMQWAMPGGDQAGAYGLRQLLASMASAAENLMLEGCPIFIKRLRASSKLAERLKKMMQSWGTEE